MKTIFQFYVSLPCEDAHSRHPTGEAGGFAQRLHPLIISKISNMVSTGITDVTNIKCSLKWYVQHELKQTGNSLKITDRSLYPTDNDIRNHVYLAKKSMEISKLDQEQLQFKLEKFKVEMPSLQAFYRPFVKIEDTSKQDGSSSSKDCNQTSQPDGTNFSQKFLLVLQE